MCPRVHRSRWSVRGFEGERETHFTLRECVRVTGASAPPPLSPPSIRPSDEDYLPGKNQKIPKVCPPVGRERGCGAEEARASPSIPPHDSVSLSPPPSTPILPLAPGATPPVRRSSWDPYPQLNPRTAFAPPQTLPSERLTDTHKSANASSPAPLSLCCVSPCRPAPALTCSNRTWLLAFSFIFPLDHFCSHQTKGGGRESAKCER